MFRIRIRIEFAFDDRLDPDADLDPGGLKRANKKEKRIQKANNWAKKGKKLCNWNTMGMLFFH
jgi:hypothetical protein